MAVKSGILGKMPMRSLLFRFAADDSGASAVEYALLLVLVAMAVLGAALTLGTNLGRNYDNIARNM